MAKLYGQNGSVDFAAANLVSFGGSFTRMNGQPIDKSQVWYADDTKSALERAKEYAASSSAYVGQVISVIDTQDDGSSTVAVYKIEDAEGTLSEVGTIPVGDSYSVEVIDDKIQLKNFGTGYYAYVPAVKNAEGEIITPSTYTYTEGFVSGLEPRVRPVTGSADKFEIAWYEPSTETIEGVNTKVDSITESVDNLDSILSGNETSPGLIQEVDDIQESIYGVDGTAESPAEGSIAWSVDELDKIVGLSDKTSGLAKDVATLQAKVNSLPTEDTNTTYTFADGSDGTFTVTPSGSSAHTVQAVKINTNDKVLTLDTAGLLATLSLEYDSKDRQIKLLGKDGTTQIGDAIDASVFIKDGMLESAELVSQNDEGTPGTFFKFKFNQDAEGNEIYVDVADLVDTYTAGNGVAITNNKVAVKVASDESYLEATASGLKTKGIADIAEAVASKLDTTTFNSYKTATDGSINSINGNITNINEKISTLETNIADAGNIDAVKINGTALAITDKAVDIPLATAEKFGVVKSSASTNKITVGTDGTMEVNNVSISKLTQNDSEVLVLDGGTAAELLII